jgi:hypothetical protein
VKKQPVCGRAERSTSLAANGTQTLFGSVSRADSSFLRGRGRLLCASPPLVSDGKIDEGHRLVAVRAVPARPDAAAEDATVRAALLAQEAGRTRRTLVDRLVRHGTRWDRFGRGSMAAAPEGLPAGGRTDALASHRCEWLRTDGTSARLANVTPRGFRHAGLPLAAPLREAPRLPVCVRVVDSSGPQ